MRPWLFGLNGDSHPLNEKLWTQGAVDACLFRGWVPVWEMALPLKILLCYKINNQPIGPLMRKRNSDRQSEILGLLESSPKPMSAYQILSALQSREPEIAPPTVYRTLNALTEQGRAHRLESAKAFVPCRCDHADSVSVLAICNDCGAVDEHDGGTVVSKLTPLMAASGFKAQRHVVEIHGLCRGCAA